MINNSVILGLLIATIIATAFHFWKGKKLSSIILYVVLSYIGFIGGHVFATFLYITFDLIGAVHVVFGAIGSIISILLGHWLIPAIEIRSENNMFNETEAHPFSHKIQN